MYNIKDILSDEQKKTLKENKIDYDVVINNDKEMRQFVSLVFNEVAGYKNIQSIADTIVLYHNSLKEA